MPSFRGYIPEIGNGWGPAVLETEEEMNFVGAGTCGLNTAAVNGVSVGLNSAWIGGEADVTGSISYQDYNPVSENEDCWFDNSFSMLS